MLRKSIQFYLDYTIDTSPQIHYSPIKLDVVKNQISTLDTLKSFHEYSEKMRLFLSEKLLL